MSPSQSHTAGETSSSKRSKVTSERVALLVLGALLAAAVIVICRLAHAFIATEEGFQRLRHEHEALRRNLTEGQSLKCEDGCERFGEKCYYFSTSKFPWTASREDCRRRGADLVKIDSGEEQIFLDETLRKKMETYEDKFWIGLTDSENEGEWLWVDRSPLQSLEFWIRGEPDNWDGENTLGEDCVRMGEKGGAVDHRSWFDRSCENPHKYICERSIVNR